MLVSKLACDLIDKCNESYFSFCILFNTMASFSSFVVFCLFVFLKNGDKAASPSELTCPPGWEWEDDAWVYDINRAVDERGNN